MSYLNCECGETIYDNTDLLSHKGRILKDQDDPAFFEAATDEIVALIEAVRNGTREQLAKTSCLPFHAAGADDHFIYALLNHLFIRYSISLYECTHCGRIHIQKPGEENTFVAYSTRGVGTQQVLRSTRLPETE